MQLSNYNETDAAIFAHTHISPEMQKKYSVDQIEFLLDLVYEYYDSLDADDNDENPEIDPKEMLVFINENILKEHCEKLTRKELEEILNADNAYMESIGMIDKQKDDQPDDGSIDIDDLVEQIYPMLPAEIRRKYSIDDVYTILCIESDLLDQNADIEDNALYDEIKKAAVAEKITISTDDITQILDIESEFLGEDEEAE